MKIHTRQKVNSRNAFTMIELIFSVIILGIIIAGATNVLMSKSDKLNVSMNTNQMFSDITTAMSLFKRSYYNSQGKYANAEAKEVFLFIPDSTRYVLADDTTTKSYFYHEELEGIKVYIGSDSLADGSSDNLRYSILFNGADFKSNTSMDDQEAKQLEGEIQAYFSKACPDAVFIGDSTTTELDSTAQFDVETTMGTAIDNDLIIHVGNCGS